MKITYKQYELVTAYLKGELSGKERTDFEATLATNEVLREELIFQRSILSAVQLNVTAATLQQATLDNLLEDKTLHPKLEVIQNDMQQARVYNINRQKRVRRWWISGLAAVACVLGVLFFSNHLITNAQLDKEIASWEIEFDTSGSDYEEVSSSMTEIETAKKYYEKGKRKAAFTTLDSISDSQLPDRILLAKGKIQAQLKNYQASKELLIPASLSTEAIVRDKACLALGMVYLRLRKKEAAKKQLEQIRTESLKIEAARIMEKYL